MKSDKIILRKDPDLNQIELERTRRFLHLSLEERFMEAFDFNNQLSKMFPQANKKPTQKGLFIPKKCS